MVSILHPLTRNQFSAKNFASLIAFLQNLQIKEPIHIPIIDITYLLTNKSLDKTIERIRDTFFDNNASFQLFNGEEFTKHFQMACKDTHFIFNTRIYKQHDGVTVATLLNPILGNILCHHEQI